MSPRTAMTLRLLGPLIEILCLIPLMKERDQGRTIVGIPIEYPLYAGLVLGLSLVVVGLAFSRSSTKRPRDTGQEGLR